MPCSILGHLEKKRKESIPYKDRLRKLSRDNMGGGMTTNLIIICVISWSDNT